MEDLYSRRTNLIIGFHGCDEDVANKVVMGEDNLKASENDYDWLGHGVYFWENNQERALQWAVDNSKRKGSNIKKPAVLGAVIDLGFCFDLTDSKYLSELKQGYKTLLNNISVIGLEMPQNTDIGNSHDKLIRKLDCAVIETVHSLNNDAEVRPYDSVKGMFVEGDELYPGSGFNEKNHIQICLRNPNCIKGFFIPRKLDMAYGNP